MKIYKSKICCLLFIIVLIKINIYGQDEIKKIIYNDITFMNELYDYQIFSKKSTVLYIKGNDTVLSVLNWEQLKQNYQNIDVVKIDTINDFYFVDVKIRLSSTGIINLREDTLSYVLFKKK